MRSNRLSIAASHNLGIAQFVDRRRSAFHPLAWHLHFGLPYVVVVALLIGFEYGIRKIPKPPIPSRPTRVRVKLPTNTHQHTPPLALTRRLYASELDRRRSSRQYGDRKRLHTIANTQPRACLQLYRFIGLVCFWLAGQHYVLHILRLC